MTRLARTADTPATELRIVGKLHPKECRVVVRKLSREEARSIFPYRPYSNDAETPYGGGELYDDVCLLVNERAKRCRTCGAAVRYGIFAMPAMLNQDGTQCPDCCGVAEHAGIIDREGNLL